MPTLKVLRPGLFTTVQDLGRSGQRSAGIPPGGAMDRFALVAANLLVGNPEGEGALECSLEGPILRAQRACVVAVTGADFQPRRNHTPIPMWTGLLLAEGDVLSLDSRRAGARCYLAVAGGFAADRWLGSVATYPLVARGGLEGRPLREGDVLIHGRLAHSAVVGRELPRQLRPAYGRRRLAVIPGPHWKRLTAAGRRALLSDSFRVSRDADRMGYRLEGPALELAAGELLSFGVTAGCLQVPGSGQPILLMADHQTAGGYPVVATVVSADLPLAAQLLPGDEVGFEETTLEEAQARRLELWSRLDRLRG